MTHKIFSTLGLDFLSKHKGFHHHLHQHFSGFLEVVMNQSLAPHDLHSLFKKYLKDSTFIYLFIMCIWEGVDMPLSMCGDHRPICLGVNSKDWIQVIGFGVRSLYLLSHLTNSDFKILTIWCHYPFLMLSPPNFLDTLYSSASFYERFGWPFHYLSIL